jgi:type I restriction enzyme S subunit
MRLSDLCNLVALQVDPQSCPRAVYIGLEHVASGRFERIGEGQAGDVQSAKYAFQPRDVLYGKLRPYLDKAVLASGVGVCTTELLVLRPKDGVDPRFLVSVVHLPTFIEHAVAGATGVQHPRTSWSHIADFELPEFDSNEQTKIGNLLWEVHEAITANDKATDAGAELKRGAMRELFTRGLRGEAQKETEIGPVPESWVVSALGELTTLERGRFLHRPRNEPRFYGGGTPFVQTGDVVRSGGRIREYTQTLNDDGVAISRVFPVGTILITIAANIGFAGILQFDSACPDSLIAITPNDRLNNEFLEYWLQTQQPEMDRLAPKGTQKNINIQFLSPWPVVVSSLEEQGEIVFILDAIDRKIELHRKKRAVLDELFKALLHKLMTGEIRVADLDLSALRASPSAMFGLDPGIHMEGRAVPSQDAAQ